jgi:hypothetical protein
LLIALLWGTLRLFGTRNTTMGNGNILEENFWAFGQALATAMLGLLVFSAIETYIGQIDVQLGVNLLMNYQKLGGN